jgi:hypothetical protein
MTLIRWVTIVAALKAIGAVQIHAALGGAYFTPYPGSSNSIFISTGSHQSIAQPETGPVLSH